MGGVEELVREERDGGEGRDEGAGFGGYLEETRKIQVSGSATRVIFEINQPNDVSRDTFPCFVTLSSCSEIISKVIRKALADPTSVWY